MTNTTPEAPTGAENKILVVIEAIGKKDKLRAVMQELGYDAEVFATKGSLAGFKNDTDQIGIDDTLTPHGRGYKSEQHQWAADRIREKAAASNGVFIATDADEEGDAIAWDVCEVIKDVAPEILRLQLSTLDADDVRSAIERSKPVEKKDAIPGRTREIIDRAIGATFSGDGVAVGRIGTALLGAIANDKPAVYSVRLVAPAADGGKPFFAEADVKEPLDKATAEKLALTRFPAIGVSRSETVDGRAANDMGHALVSASQNLDLSPKEAAKAMQRSYEAGRLSYPRSASGRMSAGAQSRLNRALQRVDARFSSEKIPQANADDVHDAPHPTTKVDPKTNPAETDREEGVRIQITRDLIKSGQKRQVETADADRIREALKGTFSKAVIEHVVRLEWRREQGPKAPGERGRPKPGVTRKRNDAVALEVMLDNNLGRPSTYASHVETFVERGLVDEDLNLTAKGQRWLDAAPTPLRDPRLSAAIEQACANPPADIVAAAEADPNAQPWQDYASRIIDNLPRSVRDPVKEKLAQNPAPERRQRPAAPDRHPGVHHNQEDAKPGFDLDDALVDAPQLAPEAEN